VALLAVPNVSEGRDAGTIAAIGRAWELTVLDVHSDPDHNRTVYTLAGGDIPEGLARGAREAIGRIDLRHHAGIHPHVGSLDVAPVVYTTEADRGAACAQALVAADLIARQEGVPVFLYGVLGGGRTRAELRRDGVMRMAERVANGALVPDFGPPRLHPTAGAVLVAARPPLVAFNLELAPGVSLVEAKAVARAIRRELPAVRALGLPLSGAVQLSFNVEDPLGTPLRDLVAAVRRRAAVTRAELVGLAPAAAWEGFPEDLPVPGFDPERHLLENALARASY
jgi:glutamate formiminotransferase / 5-formyltetrahydrofolate cyclo-ligase